MAQTIGHGSQFEVNTTGATYVVVAGCQSGAFGSNKVDTLDTTDLGTSGSSRTFLGGLENPGDFSAKFNLLPGDATQGNLVTLKDGTVHNFKFITPGATATYSFSGVITSIDRDIPDDKLMTMTCKIQISGPITIS